jgi:hypothetical protein
MTIAQLLGKFKLVLDAVVPLIIGLAVVVVLWGIFNYVARGGEEEKRAEGKRFVVYGIVGLFLMTSIWGMVNLLVKTFDLNNTIDTTKIPKVPTICPSPGVTPRPPGC